MVTLVLLVAQACGADAVQQPGAVRWDPSAHQASGHLSRVRVRDDDGNLDAPGFNELVDSSAPDWAGQPDTAAAELLGLNGPFDGQPEQLDPSRDLARQPGGDRDAVPARRRLDHGRTIPGRVHPGRRRPKPVPGGGTDPTLPVRARAPTVPRRPLRVIPTPSTVDDQW